MENGARLADLLGESGLLIALLDHMQDGLAVLDVQGVHVFVNEALCSMTGFSKAELLDVAPPFPYWPQEERVSIEQAFDLTLRGRAGNFELTFCRKSGERFAALVAPAELRNERGEPIAYYATVKDISVRKELERRLQRSEQRWRSVAENPFDFVVLIDREYRYQYVNHTAPGVSPESLIGRATPFDFVDLEYHGVMRAAFEHAFSHAQAASYEVYVPQLDTWYGSVVGPVIEDNRVVAASILTRDITAQKRAEHTLERSEQRLREAHKIETIGTLAGGIAHDLNNLLTPVLAHAELAGRTLPEGHAAIAHLSAIRTASMHARDLVQRVLLFSRRQGPNKEVFDLRAAVLEDIELLRASMPATIALNVSVTEQPVPVHGDRGQLSQALTNLATNALQAMKSTAGQLRIALTVTETESAQPVAVMTVEDTGPGMSPETMRRAFEPFFTTKPVGEGTGLGLSIVQAVAREHGGDACVDSELGRGTQVSLRLPTTRAPAPEKPVSDRPEKKALRPLSILCVDDEVAIAAVVRAVLESEGHRVTVLGSAQEASALFERDPHAFDVLLTDQTMPHLTGIELIARVRALRPDLPCILMTGLVDDDAMQQASALRIDAMLAKPFPIFDLVAVIERAVAAAGS